MRRKGNVFDISVGINSDRREKATISYRSILNELKQRRSVKR